MRQAGRLSGYGMQAFRLPARGGRAPVLHWRAACRILAPKQRPPFGLAAESALFVFGVLIVGKLTDSDAKPVGNLA